MTNQTGRAGGDAGGPSSNSAGGKNRNDTIDCLLNLRSVRDQFKDAELDLSNDKVAHQLRELEEQLVDHLAEERELRDGVGLLTVAVVGDFNSGKSTFINALLGTKLCPVGDEPTTASVTYFIHGDRERYELERDGTRTSIERGQYLSIVRHSKVGEQEANVLHVSIDSPVLEHVRLVDTPGFNAPPPNSNDTKVTEDSIATADVLFLIMDARKGNPSKTLLGQLDRLRNNLKTGSGPPAFLLLNKAELLPPSQRKEVESVCEKQYDDRFRSVALVSALRLNETDDSVPLDVLEMAARRIRAALSRQESFEAKVSAGVVTEQGQASYRVDIDGNVCRSSVLSDDGLASREQLVEMVRSVAPKRHFLLEKRFRRRTSQLRKDWLRVASDLEGLCKRAARTAAGVGVGDATDDRVNEALTAIDDAKSKILVEADRMFHEAAAEAVFKSQSEESFWGTIKYYVEVRPDAVQDAVENDEFWEKNKLIMRRLIDFMKRVNHVVILPDSDGIAAELREHGAAFVRESLESDRQTFEESEWEPHDSRCWRLVYKDEETLRDDRYDGLRLAYESDATSWTLILTEYLQPTIDKIQEAVIRHDEKRQAAVRDQDDELTRLRERVARLKEYTP